jgi:hypothetical protein
MPKTITVLSLLLASLLALSTASADAPRSGGPIRAIKPAPQPNASAHHRPRHPVAPPKRSG